MTAEPLADRSPSGRKIRSLRAPSRARLLFLIRKYALKRAKRDLARLSLWTPVVIAIGAGFYFALKSEPPWQAGFAFLLISLVVSIRFERTRAVAIPVTFAALGFVAADLRTAQVEAPQLWRDLGIVEATGRLISVEESPDQRRYVIALQSIEGVEPDELPARARISWRGDGFDADRET